MYKFCAVCQLPFNEGQPTTRLRKCAHKVHRICSRMPDYVCFNCKKPHILIRIDREKKKKKVRFSNIYTYHYMVKNEK